MSNSTQAAPAKAPILTPAPAPAYFVPSPVETVVSLKVAEPVNFSWIGIVGLLAAFLLIAIIALVCLWYKKRAYKQALVDQRKFFTAKRQTSNPNLDPEPDWLTFEDEESDERSKRGQLILADYENLALGSSHTTSTRFSEDLECASSGKLSGGLDQEISGYARNKRVVRENHHVNVLRSKFSWNLEENLVDEVFYRGEEGSSQMGVRYSRTDFENLEIFTQVGAPKKKRSESESASLFKGLYTIAVESPPTGKWTLRTFSLPLYRQRFSPPGSRAQCPDVAGQHATTPSKMDSSDSPHQVTGSTNSLPPSPAHSFSPNSAFGTKRLTKASSWTPKPSRLGSRSNVAQMQNSAFIIPPTPPPLPLPLPDTTEESWALQWRTVDKGVESKWTIANDAPFAPTLTPSQIHGCVSSPPPPPPPFPALPCKRVPQPPSPLPLACALDRKPSTPPSPLCSEDGIQEFRAKAASPPSPPCLVNGIQGLQVKATPPPSPLPPCSDAGIPENRNTTTPPPSPPPLPTRSPPPASPLPGSRPLLAPLILPGRPDLGDSRSAEDFRPNRHHKMRPLHWEKLKPESRLTMVWDTIRDSMELDEDMIENLFGVTTRSDSESEIAKRASNLGASALEKTDMILDPKKAHNIAIQLRARGLASATVCDALLDGDGLDQENLELLVKMTPTDEELTRFQEYKGDLTLLGPADRFVHGILQIPSAFERLHALLFKASYWEELHQIQEMIVTLELLMSIFRPILTQLTSSALHVKMACKELKGSRTFLKLLEVVLKTGNRLNTGTFRGDAKAFKLDTLLKLADVKGVDGKTTLLHFVIQEIMKAEGARATRLANVSDATMSSTPTSSRSSLCTTPSSTSSPLSHFATTMETHFDHNLTATATTSDDFRRAGMGIVRGIPAELLHVRKAGAIDIVALRLAVSKLQSGLQDVRSKHDQQSRDESTTMHDDDVFREKMSAFVGDAETQVREVHRDLELVLANVKAVSVYFYGETDTAKSTQPALKVFMVMREFLSMLEQACKDVTMKGSYGNGATAMDASSSSPSKPPPRSLVT